MDIELRHLRLLVAVAEFGSLNAAARRLHLTPSALSLQLRSLEERLGGRLFERKWRRLHATPAGARLTRSARAVLAELDAAGEETRDLLEGREGTVRITTECMQSYRWLPGVMHSWARTHPAHAVQIVAEAGAEPLEALRREQIDLALTVGRSAPDGRLVSTRLFRDELVALVGSRHPLAKKKRIDVAAFAAEPYWGSPDSYAPGTPLGEAFARESIAFHRPTPMPFSSGVPLEMTRANLAVTMGPRWFVAREVARREVAALRIGRGLWLEWFVTTRAVGTTPATRDFVEAMKRHHPGRARGGPAAIP